MSQASLKSGNPLAPFIVFFALVILLTIAIANMKRPEEPSKEKADASKSDGRMITLSPMKDVVLEKPSKTAKPIQVDGPEAKSTPDLKKLLSEAFKAYDEGNFAVAEDKFRTVLLFEPENVKALSSLGGLLYRQGKYSDAELFFRAQTKLVPDDSAAYNNLGAALAKQRKFAEAIKSVEMGLEINPESGVALFNLSGMNSLAGNTQEAIDNFKKAYLKLGERILPLSSDPNLDNIRYLPEFKSIIEQIDSGWIPQRERSMPFAEEPPPAAYMDQEQQK